MDNKSIAQSWLEQAADDLRWCQSGVDGEVWHGACFSAQQVAEKSLKAFLFAHGKSAKKIHDLGALLEICRQIDSEFESLREIVLPLTDYYLQTRYPDIGDFMDYTEEKARKALDQATSIHHFVTKRLSSSKL